MQEMNPKNIKRINIEKMKMFFFYDLLISIGWLNSIREKEKNIRITCVAGRDKTAEFMCTELENIADLCCRTKWQSPIGREVVTNHNSVNEKK
jgi:hypothetical protein